MLIASFIAYWSKFELFECKSISNKNIKTAIQIFIIYCGGIICLSYECRNYSAAKLRFTTSRRFFISSGSFMSNSRCPSNASKSNSSRSANCDGETFCNAPKMLCRRFGYYLSHSRSMSLMMARCKFSCEPHRLHGMMGNLRNSAYLIMSFSST